MGGPSSPPTAFRAPRTERLCDDVSPCGRQGRRAELRPGRPRLRAYDPAQCPSGPRSSRCGTSRSASRGSSRTTTSASTCVEGEVHALLGENGAGKSTLMNILYGLYHADEGEILIKGKPVRLGSPSASIEAGVGMVHQHFMLIPVMTVAENIVLAEEPTRERRPPRRPRGRAARPGDLGPLRARRRPGGEDRGHHRRPAAARRDPEGALPRRRHPRPRRADRGAHAAGGAGALRGHPRPHGARQVGHLHHAQAERGARHRRPDHRPAPRQADRDAAGRGRHGGEPRAPDGRARGAAPGREDRRATPGDAAAPGRGPARPRRPRASRRSAASRSRCGPARSSASPASTGTARRS